MKGGKLAEDTKFHFLFEKEKKKKQTLSCFPLSHFNMPLVMYSIMFWESLAKTRILRSLTWSGVFLTCGWGSDVSTLSSLSGTSFSGTTALLPGDMWVGPSSPAPPANIFSTSVLPVTWRFILHAWWQNVLAPGGLKPVEHRSHLLPLTQVH